MEAISIWLMGHILKTGMIIDSASSNTPAGWLICDGSAISRADFANLYRAIGTSFGVGDGSTTFNIPDLRGRGSVGFAVSGGHSDVSTLGNNDGVAVANRRPKHNHTNSVTATTGNQSADHTHTGTTGVQSANHTHGSSIGYTGAGGTGGGQQYLIPSASSPGGAGSPGVYTDTTGNQSADHTHTVTTGVQSANHTHAVTVGGTVGPAGTNPNDSPAYLVLYKLIKV